MFVQLTPHSGASQRTKNRIKEHGPKFSISKVEAAVPALGHQAGILVVSTNGWTGWLLSAEVVQSTPCSLDCATEVDKAPFADEKWHHRQCPNHTSACCS